MKSSFFKFELILLRYAVSAMIITSPAIFAPASIDLVQVFLIILLWSIKFILYDLCYRIWAKKHSIRVLLYSIVYLLVIVADTWLLYLNIFTDQNLAGVAILVSTPWILLAGFCLQVSISYVAKRRHP